VDVFWGREGGRKKRTRQEVFARRKHQLLGEGEVGTLPFGGEGTSIRGEMEKRMTKAIQAVVGRGEKQQSASYGPDGWKKKTKKRHDSIDLPREKRVDGDGPGGRRTSRPFTGS